MEIGGNIVLENFECMDVPKIIVVKKMIGNYARKISDIKPFKKLILKNGKELEVILQIDSGEIIEKIEAKNLFFAMDKVLNAIIERVK